MHPVPLVATTRGYPLDGELAGPGWFHLAGDTQLLFDTPADERWKSAFAKAGIDPRLLAPGTGTA